MPAFMLPQILLAGLIVPRERALARATADDVGAHLAFDVALVCGSIVLTLVLEATTFGAGQLDRIRPRTEARGPASHAGRCGPRD